MLTRVRNHVLDRMARRKYAPDIEVDKAVNLRRLGSRYASGHSSIRPISGTRRL
jgi:hypothetical protein